MKTARVPAPAPHGPRDSVVRIAHKGLACRVVGMLGEDVRSHANRADHRECSDPLEQPVAMIQKLLVGRPFVPCHDQHSLDQAAEDRENREEQGEVRGEQHPHPPFIGQLPKRGRDQEWQEEPADPADGERARDMARIGKWVETRVDGAEPKRDQGEGSCPGEDLMDAVAAQGVQEAKRRESAEDARDNRTEIEERPATGNRLTRACWRLGSGSCSRGRRWQRRTDCRSRAAGSARPSTAQPWREGHD